MSTPVTAEEVETLLQAGLSPERLAVRDTSGGCGASFATVIVSAAFEGLRPLDRHRAVNAALGERVEAIHALAIRAWTPAQFEKKGGETALEAALVETSQ
jgi:stress-induced morphogen